MPVYISFIHLHYVIGDLLMTKKLTKITKELYILYAKYVVQKLMLSKYQLVTFFNSRLSPNQMFKRKQLASSLL